MPILSVVVPVFHEAAIAANLRHLSGALDRIGTTWEVVVVVDGDPETLRAALDAPPHGVRVLSYAPHRGKGCALRYGLAQTRGQLVTILDGDLEIAPEEIGRMATLLRLYDADMVLGSKRHPLSEVSYPLVRRVQSLGFQLLVRLLFRVNVSDTQTGLKVMRREVALRVLDAALVKRFAFDVELIVLARHFGYRRIIEAPVRIDYRFRSTTNLRAVLATLWDTAAIFYRLRIRRWYDGNQPAGRNALAAAVGDVDGLDA